MHTTRWGATALAAALAATPAVASGHAGHPAPAAASHPGPAAASQAANSHHAVTSYAAGLSRFYGQQIQWHKCQLGPSDTGGQELDKAGARCADIRVPLDYAHPGGRTITVAISRLAADPSARRIGPMIINLGGPATPVLTDVLLARQAMGATGARFDLIGMDQRFAGRSSPIDCHWPDGWLPRGAGAGRPGFNEMVSISKDLAQRCASTEGAMLPFASTANAARDMDVIRGALHAQKMSFLGYSYGTYLGALYTQLFPGHARRIVLDSAIDPAHPGVAKGNVGPQRERGLSDWAGWAAKHDSTYHLGSTADAVVATVMRVYHAAAKQPLRVGPYQVDDTVIPAVLIDPLSDDNVANEAEAAAVVRSLNLAAQGKPANPDAELRAALANKLTGAGSALSSAQTAIMCADAAVPTDPNVYWRNVQSHRASAPLFSPVDQTITPCAFWAFRPAGAPPRVANHVPALVVQAAGDINAILPLGKAMHHALAASRMITLQGVRTHGVYLFRGSACVDGNVNAYLNSGKLPAQDISCPPAP